MKNTESPVRHLGLIMDGNRRWAKANGKSTIDGHRAGFKALKDLLSTVQDLGIEYVSVYAFSTENWKRSKAEVQALMGLVRWVFSNELDEFNKKNVRLKVAGSMEKVPKDIVKLIANAEAATEQNDGGTLVICFNYGGQEEIVDAIKQYADDGGDIASLDADALAQNLYVPELPPIDLLIRSSGEQRLSNYMLWRSAYAEFSFTKTLWPDFSSEELTNIVEEYAARNRRFGV